ncbi:MAG TPA: sigma 54-interacting transcriptional regulator [Polyangiaceae bacterium]|nr:sigma 54-interacting transcriptional regulator [Polyangiaceae bacterium]
MLTAVVAIDGALGDAVAETLERAWPAWASRRVVPHVDVAQAEDSCADVVVVDERLAISEATRLGKRFQAKVLVLGRDVEKPFAISALRAKALSLAERPSEIPDFVALDPVLQNALAILTVASRRAGGVLITGPTGVGKERLARYVHERSGRKGAFLAVNCAAFSDGLVESALFGHTRGAFTGAVANADGAFVEADGGTLFLDEVGELDRRIQAKLLRVLEDHKVRALGAARDRAVDLKVVAATNRDLRAEMQRDQFRSDLYFRLATFVVQVPPLRERLADLSALIDLFIQRHERAADLRLTADARTALERYGWPGNVRELRNVMERVLTLATESEITLPELRRWAPELFDSPPARGACVALEQRFIESARNGELSKQRAAEEIGVHRTTLWRRMKKGGKSSEPTR